MSSLFYTVLIFVVQLASLGASPATLRDESPFQTGHLEKVDPGTGTHHSLTKDEIRNLAKNENHFLRFYFDEDKLSPLTMRVSQGSVWAKDSEVVVREGPDAMPVALTLDADCFLRGGLVGVEGAVHINTCGSMTVSIQTPHHLYDLEEHETQEVQGRTKFRVTRREQEEEEMAEELEGMRRDVMDRGSMEEEEEEVGNQNGTVRRKRSTQTVTIELVVYLDQNYVQYQIDNMGRRTRAQLENFIISKWDAIQNEFSDPRLIGARVRIELKRIEIWYRNPTGYPANEARASERLSWFCYNTPETRNFDLKMLYTRGTGGQEMGLAYVGTVCQPYSKCSLVKSSTSKVRVELHEMGHNLGFPHHPKIAGCEDYPEGFMGWAQTNSFSPCYRQPFRQYLRRSTYDCLFHKDVFSGINSRRSSSNSNNQGC